MSYSEFERLNDLKCRAASDLNLTKEKFEEALEVLVKNSQRISDQIGKLERANVHFQQLVVHTDVDELHKEELGSFIAEELKRKQESQEEIGKNFGILRHLVIMLSAAVVKVSSVTSEKTLNDLVVHTMDKVNESVKALKM